MNAAPQESASFFPSSGLITLKGKKKKQAKKQTNKNKYINIRILKTKRCHWYSYHSTKIYFYTFRNLDYLSIWRSFLFPTRTVGTLKRQKPDCIKHNLKRKKKRKEKKREQKDNIENIEI